MELDDNIYKQILNLCNNGKFKLKIGKNNEAIENYKKALELVPEPKDNWKASFWIYESIGDAYFYDFLYKECLEWMMKAFALPDGPLGISMRTYLNEEMIELFGMDYLLELPAYVEKLEWGGLRIDLVKEPWNTEMDEIFEAWIKAMNYLKSAKVFSEYIYKGDGILANIITSDIWRKFLDDINKK